jgi:hypothetical protein
MVFKNQEPNCRKCLFGNRKASGEFIFSSAGYRRSVSSGVKPQTGAEIMSLGTILIIILVIALLGGLSGLGGGPFYGTGYYGGGGLGLLLLIIIILVVLGRI